MKVSGLICVSLGVVNMKTIALQDIYLTICYLKPLVPLVCS